MSSGHAKQLALFKRMKRFYPKMEEQLNITYNGDEPVIPPEKMSEFERMLENTEWAEKRLRRPMWKQR